MERYWSTIIKPFTMALIIGSVVFTSCKEDHKAEVIIAKKPAKAVKKTVQKVGDYVQTRKVEWLGAVYAVTVERTADTSLPLVEDESGNKFYDNTITVTIKRQDNSTFFSRTFTKSAFASSLGTEGSKGVLLGIVLDRAQASTLYFAASVGSPDKTSDEYVPLVMSIDRNGNVSIKRDSKLDTVSDDADDEV